MAEPFDPIEAERLARNTLVLTEELLDPGREIRETVALHRAADEAARAAAERSRLLSEYHRGMIGLWRRLACAQEVGDMVLVVETVDAIRKATEAEFGRRSTMS